MSKINELGTKPIWSLLIKFSVPAVIAMVVNAIYNVVDRIFIGQYAGEDALAGITFAFPIMLMIFAFANLVGIGGSALLAIRLGENDKKRARRIFGNTLSLGLLVLVILVVSILLNLQNLLILFGTTPDLMVYAVDYLVIILLGYIFQMFSFILSSFIRTEGKPTLTMVIMLVSAVTNIILDYIFIGILDSGVKGAAYATIIAQFIGLMIAITYYVRGGSKLHLKLKDFKPKFKIYMEIVSIGFASFLSTVGASVAMVFLNRELVIYGGIMAVTSMGAINSLYTFFIMPINGVTQGMQPIMGFNYGAKNKKRVIKTLKCGIIIGIVFSTVVFLLLQLFPTTFISLFLDPRSKTMPIAINGLRIFIFMLPVLSINIMGIAYFQSIERGKTSIAIGLLRQFIFLIPIVLILPKFMGLNGVWFTTPIADALAIIITVIVFLVNNRRKNKVEMKSSDRII
jgi:putative MATE family efflux protein